MKIGDLCIGLIITLRNLWPGVLDCNNDFLVVNAIFSVGLGIFKLTKTIFFQKVSELLF